MTETCPICGAAMTAPPALSRADNETEICSDCGMWQAVADARGHHGSGLPYCCYSDLPGHTVIVDCCCSGYREASPGMAAIPAMELNARLGITEEQAHKVKASSMRRR